MADALVGYAVFGWAPFACFVVGVLYFASVPAAAPTLGRIASVSYAPASALLFLVLALNAPTFRAWSLSTPLFFAIQALPLLLMSVSLASIRRPRWVQFILAPIALLCIAWQVTWSYWSVYGK